MLTTATCRIPVGLGMALANSGVSYAEVLASARLPAHHLDVPGERLSVPEYFALWDAIRAASGVPSIGIRLAQMVPPDLMEPLFLALLSCRCVADAFKVLCTYKRMLSPETIEVQADGVGYPVRVVFCWPALRREPPQALVDAELAFLTEVCRRATRTPELAPLELCLRAATLDPGAGHSAFFRCPVRLNAERTSLLFRAEDTALPFITHNPRMLDALVPYLQANPSPAPDPVVARVRELLPSRIRGQHTTVNSIGRELGMSSRTLQRALREGGTSFRQILDEVRNTQARRYLSAGGLSDTEIAFLLGFEETNSFYRAFRSWAGKSPSEFRREQTAHPAHQMKSLRRAPR
jgi:AraC-like DNA-binding protein